MVNTFFQQEGFVTVQAVQFSGYPGDCFFGVSTIVTLILILSLEDLSRNAAGSAPISYRPVRNTI